MSAISTSFASLLLPYTSPARQCVSPRNLSPLGLSSFVHYCEKLLAVIVIYFKQFFCEQETIASFVIAMKTPCVQ